jgi:DNA repair protein NreA
VKINIQKKFNENAKEDFSGKAPNVFIGKYGYPNINVGILSAENYENNDNVPFFVEKNLQVNNIVNLRTNLINSHFKANVKDFNGKLLEISKEISLAKNPVDIEVSLSKKPYFSVTFAQDVAPFGPSVSVKKAAITENPKIPEKVEKIVNDDLKANEALKLLHEKGIDEHYLAKIFSVGNLGSENRKKLVPTRWSITAIDDNLGKFAIDEIKNYPEHDYAAFFGVHLGNYYLILLIPELFRYELFETYAPRNGEASESMTDYESFNGRKEYAFETAGGYYAARIAVLEYLQNVKKKASVLCLRFITEEYTAPLGVWVVREASRNSMKQKPVIFKDKKEMIDYAKRFAKENFNYDLNIILAKSKLLKELSQPRLKDFF